MADRRLKRLILIALTAALAASAFPARVAAGTLDQQSDLTYAPAGFGLGSGYEVAQSFIAGLDGALDQVDVVVWFDTSAPEPCNRGSGITLAIRTVADAKPTNTTLARANLPGSSISSSEFPGSWVSLSFAAPTEVTAGTQYALVLSAPDASCTGPYVPYGIPLAKGDPYPAGGGMGKNPGSSVWENLLDGNWDFPFKTYVAPPVGPSPPPSNAISLGKAVLNKAKGTATVAVFVPGPGLVTLTGKGVIKQRREKASAGIVNMLVKPAGKAKRKLNSTGKAKVKFTITFTPTGGTSISKSKSVGLKKRLR
jgi:hypothetical protein